MGEMTPEERAARLRACVFPMQSCAEAQRDPFCLRCEQAAEIAGEIRAAVAQAEREKTEEVAEFNAGYKAQQKGEPESAEPVETKYDVWMCGYAWAAYFPMKKRIRDLEEQDEVHWKTRRILLKERDEALALLKRYEEKYGEL